MSLISSDEKRPNLAEFTPSIWGDYFMSCASNDDHSSLKETMENNKESYVKIIELKEQVKNKLLHGLHPLENPLETLEYIDDIQRLGLSYYFENEIEQVLKQFHNNNNLHHDFGDNLYADALRFRLLREQGYNSACVLSGNIPIELSLFRPSETCPNAPYSKEPTKKRGKTLHITLPPTTFSRKASFNFAKLDFNLLQQLHQKELNYITRWWKEFDFKSKQSFSRDRIVECYIWNYGVYFEAQTSQIRLMMTKLISLLTIIDDSYDSYDVVASAVECYIKQYGVTDEEAIEKLNEQVNDSWKDLNEDLLYPIAIPRPLLMRVLNLVRVNHEMYREGDGFTQPTLLKNLIDTLIINPIH
ncbi:hypothetical protein F8388_019072 [Cannabis sativa]|uniref:Terpene synthase n=1 Tax=Cannabis sativa TaxID=3483 RepID=A0A7J6FCJ2_CANSA|nr:hypothetical protein F8388_019072 [Cannabis sativa]